MQELKLPRAQSLQEAGVSVAVLAKMMQRIVNEKLEMHSIMVLRGGKLAYEQFRAPYQPWIPHVMFSVSKSITATAVGFCVDEGLLKVTDRVADHLPELREYEADNAMLNKLTVHHLLSMSSGKEVNILADKTRKQWLRDFAEYKWKAAPGDEFSYNNENTYILSVLVQRVSGQCMVDYLTPRLFAPLGIPRPFWENDGCGAEAGGWGLYLTTESFAKIALCYTQNGMFAGRQIIPASWVQQLSAVQMPTPPGDSPHDGHGYGYCVWQSVVPGCYRMDGMFSQFALILPEYDACVVTTGGEIYSQKILNALYDHLPALFTETDTDPVAIPQLRAYPPLHQSARCPSLEEKLDGRTIFFPALMQQTTKAAGFPLSVMPLAVFFMSADKAGGIDKVKFRFEDDAVKFSWSEGKERNTVLCGLDGRARKCKITLGGTEFIVSCTAAWEGADKLHVRIRPLNSVSERRMVFVFNGKRVRMVPRSSPSLDHMSGYAAPMLATMLPNETMGKFMADSVRRLATLLEPMHIGFLR
ncbi:MAG: beta-lactamase family protein [Oscillospiraceae bacterium]|nr:beta-lactamase family protein [Oscillospiraceae bacterium]